MGTGSDWTPSPGRSRFVRRTRRRWRPCVAPPSRAATPPPRAHRRPAHTNVTPGFTDCIDYVFVSEGVEVMAAEPISGVETTRAGLPTINTLATTCLSRSRSSTDDARTSSEMI